MFDQILELFYEAPWLLVLLGSVVAAIGFYFWNIWASPAVREALRDVSERLIYAREASAGLAQSFQSLDTGFRSRVECFEGNMTKLGCDTKEVRRETQIAEKHIDKLEAHAGAVSTEVEAVTQQVNTEASELKRIEDEIKSTQDKINACNRKIDTLAYEIRTLELKRVNYQLRNSMGQVQSNTRQIEMIESKLDDLQGLENTLKIEFKRIAHQVKQNSMMTNTNVIQIEDLEQELLGFEEKEAGDFANAVYPEKPNGEMKFKYRKKLEGIRRRLAQLRSAVR